MGIVSNFKINLPTLYSINRKKKGFQASHISTYYFPKILTFPKIYMKSFCKK